MNKAVSIQFDRKTGAKMQIFLQVLDTIFQGLSTLWLIFFGGKAIWEVKKGVKLKPRTGKVLLLSILLFVLVSSFSAVLVWFRVIPITWYYPSKKVIVPGPATSTPCCIISPTPTPSPIGNIAKGNELYNKIILGGPPDKADNLDFQNDDPWGMSIYAGQQFGCVFRNDTYVAYENHLNYVQPCFANKLGSLKNFAYEVTMSVTGSGGGLIFRAGANSTSGLPSWNSAMYRFSVRPADGSFNIVVQTANAPNTNRHCDTAGDRSCQSTLIHQTGSNTLSVIVMGSTLYFYINYRCVAQITDIELTSGFIGVYAVDAGPNTFAAFTSAKIWLL
jgi:hypothetical protein